MDMILLIAIASVVTLLILCIGFFYKSNQKDVKVVNRQRPAPNRLRDGVPRRAQMQRNRGVRLRANVVHEDQGSEDENEQAEVEDNIEMPDGKIGAKKRAKLEAKAEKKAQREADEHLRQEKKKRQQLAEEERKKLEERQLAEEKQREEEERKAKEEKEKKEYEEYLKMKEAFSVEEEGYEEGEEGNEQNLLQEFVNHIKQQKVVVIEDLAAHFKLKTQAAIDRIKDLQKDDILSGVIDDRGKFIYVSQDEMEAVAKFIKQRGRVSIAELAENSNNLINLVPSTTVY